VLPGAGVRRPRSSALRGGERSQSSTLAIERHDLVDPPCVAAAREPRVEPQRATRRAWPGCKARDPSDRTFASLCSRLLRALASSWQVAARTTSYLVRDHARAQSRRIDDDAARAVAARHRFRHREREVRVIDGFRGVRAEIDRFVAELADTCDEQLLELEAAVIGAERDAHRCRFRRVIQTPLPRRTRVAPRFAQLALQLAEIHQRLRPGGFSKSVNGSGYRTAKCVRRSLPGAASSTSTSRPNSTSTCKHMPQAG
jgi:hypothetical protein